MNIAEFKNIFGDCELDGNKIVVKKDIAKVLSYIRDNYDFNMLKEIIAVDRQENGTELLYNLYSVSNGEDLILSSTVNDEAQSVSKIFDSAVADEKEIYDLFGVKFIGNNELKRLYMPEIWEGHPLKKDYKQKDERLSWND